MRKFAVVNFVQRSWSVTLGSGEVKLPLEFFSDKRYISMAYVLLKRFRTNEH